MDTSDNTTDPANNQIQALETLWTEAENHLKAASVYARRTVEEAWLAGDALTRIKTQLPHGRWLPELKERNIPARTAQRFIKLRRRYPEIRQIVAFDSVSAALGDKLLAAVEPAVTTTIDPDPEPANAARPAAEPKPAAALSTETEPQPAAAAPTAATPTEPQPAADTPAADTTVAAAAQPPLRIRPRPKRLADKRRPPRRRRTPPPRQRALVTLSRDRSRSIGGGLQLAGRRLGGSVWSRWSGRGGVLVLRMSWAPAGRKTHG